MTGKTFLAAALVAAASSAVADTQLERSLGVPAGTFGAGQLVELKRAYDDDDRTRISHLMRSGGAGILSTRNATDWEGAGPGAGERFLIATALEENRFQQAAFVAAGGLRAAPRGTEAARARLARELGVAADTYTFAKLVKLQDERDD